MDALAFGFSVFGPALALGLIGYGAFSAMGRNPSAAKDVKSQLIVVLAFAEWLGIIAALLSFLILNK